MHIHKQGHVHVLTHTNTCTMYMHTTGWNRIFYFVEANTFSWKFHLKQRNQTREKLFKIAVMWFTNLYFLYYESINASWPLVTSNWVCDKILVFPSTHSFTNKAMKEVFSCDKKFLAVAWNWGQNSVICCKDLMWVWRLCGSLAPG